MSHQVSKISTPGRQRYRHLDDKDMRHITPGRQRYAILVTNIDIFVDKDIRHLDDKDVAHLDDKDVDTWMTKICDTLMIATDIAHLDDQISTSSSRCRHPGLQICKDIFVDQMCDTWTTKICDILVDQRYATSWTQRYATLGRQDITTLIDTLTTKICDTW